MSAELMKEVKALKDSEKKTSETLGTLTKTLNGVVDKLQKSPVYPNGFPFGPGAGPTVITGENPGSRGFSMLKMMGALGGVITKDQAKVEFDLSDRLVKSLRGGSAEWSYSPQTPPDKQSVICPLSASMFPIELVDRTFRQEMKSLVCAGMEGADYDEMRWIRQQQAKSMGYSSKAMSWLGEFTGGALVAPPEMGELIELLRNREALVNAGARVIPLPPQGRLKFPRQTGASTTYWVGENAGIPESQPTVGEVTLQAKKLAVLVKMPNELIRFASPAAEALVRDDMTKSLALGLDLAGLEGAGTDTSPRGILNTPDINTITASRTTTDGDYLVGNDLYRMISAVQESNAEFETYVMRPKTLNKCYQLRGDAVAQGDMQGPFLFEMMRQLGDGVKTTIAGYPVVTSTQVSQVRAKGASTNLTYILGGMFSDVLIGMFGAIEFAATTQGDTSFANDQTWVRGILSADIALRHAAAFVLLDNLNLNLQ